MTSKRHILFVCEGNQQRSPTAERMYQQVADVEVRSAGFSPSARSQVEETVLQWADTIFVMDRRVQWHLMLRFCDELQHKKVICLDIEDEYDFMAAELVAILQRKLTPHIGTPVL